MPQQRMDIRMIKDILRLKYLDHALVLGAIKALMISQISRSDVLPSPGRLTALRQALCTA